MSAYEVKLSIKRNTGTVATGCDSLELSGSTQSNTVGPGSLESLVVALATKMVESFREMEKGR